MADVAADPNGNNQGTNMTQGIRYAAEDRAMGGRGMQTIGGIPAVTNPLPMPVQPKNGEAPDILGDNEINQNATPDALSSRFNTQPISDTFPQ